MTKKIHIEEPGDEQIPVKDKRRFNTEGEYVAEEEIKTEPVKPAAEIALESKLKIETERREAAETKLVGVQAKFEEEKTRLQNETDEMRARLRKTLEAQAKQGQFDFLTMLLPVLDNLNRAVEASETDPDITHLRDGVIGTARSFERALLEVGVEPIPSVGTDFNPELHEAVDMVTAEAENDGKIVAEYTRGYKFGDRLLRPARVQVGKAVAERAAE